MEKSIINKAIVNHGAVRIGAEDGGKPIRSRSGLLVSKPEHGKPKITVLNNENVIIDLTTMPIPKVVTSGLIKVVGETKWTDEETKKHFTDSEGRVHSVVFIDPDTGERRFGR